MRRDTPVRPSKRKQRLSHRPSHSEASWPLRDYLVESSDAVGRSVSYSVQAPPALKRMAGMIALRKTFPFDTESDVYRWCLYNGLRILVQRSEDPDLVSDFATLEGMMSVAGQQMELKIYDDALNDLLGMVESLEDAGHLVKALELSEKVWKEADRIEDPYWCKRLRKVAKKTVDKLRVRLKKVGEEG